MFVRGVENLFLQLSRMDFETDQMIWCGFKLVHAISILRDAHVVIYKILVLQREQMVITII